MFDPRGLGPLTVLKPVQSFLIPPLESVIFYFSVPSSWLTQNPSHHRNLPLENPHQPAFPTLPLLLLSYPLPPVPGVKEILAFSPPLIPLPVTLDSVFSTPPQLSSPPPFTLSSFFFCLRSCNLASVSCAWQRPYAVPHFSKARSLFLTEVVVFLRASSFLLYKFPFVCPPPLPCT